MGYKSMAFKFPYRGSLANVMSFDNSKGQITEDRYGTDDKAQSHKRASNSLQCKNI